MAHKGTYKGKVAKVPKAKRGTMEGHMMAEQEMKAHVKPAKKGGGARGKGKGGRRK